VLTFVFCLLESGTVVNVFFIQGIFSAFVTHLMYLETQG